MNTPFVPLASALALLVSGAAGAADLTIGYQEVYGPWKARMEALRTEGLGGRSVAFVRLAPGAEVIDALASGSVDIALNGSAPTAAAYTRGVDLQVIYVYDDIADAEALVVRDTIVAPQDLRGTTIAVPFASTTHFHMMFALEQFGIGPSAVDVVDMSPAAMVAAWDRGDIDGGFVWDPALGAMKEDGRVLLTSGDLGNWGKPTFDAMVARSAFTANEPELACLWIKTVAAADADYRADPGAYGPGTANAAAIARAVSGRADDVGGVLALYGYPALEEQLSARWLGGGVAASLEATAGFLKAQGVVDRVLDSYDGAVNAAFARMALDGGC